MRNIVISSNDDGAKVEQAEEGREGEGKKKEEGEEGGGEAEASSSAAAGHT